MRSLLFSAVPLMILTLVGSVRGAEDTPAPKSQPQAAAQQKTCPVSGEALNGDMGKPVPVVHQGRTIQLCCKMCVAKFQTKPELYIQKVDAELAALAPTPKPAPTPAPKAEQQTCPVSGDKLDGDMGKPVTVTHKDRTVKVCCQDCVPKFNAAPEKYIQKVDAEIAALTAKLAATPAPAVPPKAVQTTCPVSGEKLDGEMGAPVPVTYKGRTIQLCCKDCVAKFNADPETYLKKVDAAAPAGKPAPAPVPKP